MIPIIGYHLAYSNSNLSIWLQTIIRPQKSCHQIKREIFAKYTVLQVTIVRLTEANQRRIIMQPEELII